MRNKNKQTLMEVYEIDCAVSSTYGIASGSTEDQFVTILLWF